MTDHDPHAVDPDDEQRHLPSDDPLWNESHYLDVVSHDGRGRRLRPHRALPEPRGDLVDGHGRRPRPPAGGVVRLRPPGCPSSAWVCTAPDSSVDTDVEVATRPRPGPRDRRRPRIHDRPGRRLPGRPGHTDHPRPGPHVDDRRGSLPVRRHHPLRDPLPGGRDGHRGRRGAWPSRATASVTTRGVSATGGPSDGAGSPAGSTTGRGCTAPISGSRVTAWRSATCSTAPVTRVTVTGLDVTEVTDADGFPTSARARIEPGGIDLTIEPVAFGPLRADRHRRTGVSRFPRAQARLDRRRRTHRAAAGWSGTSPSPPGGRDGSLGRGAPLAAAVPRPVGLPLRPPPADPLRRDGRHGHHPPRRLPRLPRGGPGGHAA